MYDFSNKTGPPFFIFSMSYHLRPLQTYSGLDGVLVMSVISTILKFQCTYQLSAVDSGGLRSPLSAKKHV